MNTATSTIKRRLRTWAHGLVVLVATLAVLGLAPKPAHAVVNGDEAVPEIAESIARLNGGSCTGTLVHPQWVLTAKHCVNPDTPTAYGLTVGSDPNWFNVTAIRSAPYDPVYYNDVVLLHLDTPSFQPVLPLATPADESGWEVAPGQDLYGLAVGWGFDSCQTFGPNGGCVQGTSPTTVQAASVRIEYVSPPPADEDAFKKIVISAGTGYVCQGDSGSPLLTNTADGRRVVAGVLSSASCDGAGHYTRVGEGVNFGWIRSQLRAPQGSIDFNGDGAADVLAASALVNGGYGAAYSAGGASNWVNLARSSQGLNDLRFGDFNGDGVTDIFSVTRLSNGSYRWRYSAGGTGALVNLAYDSTPLRDLRFGDFDGDGRTDVFSTTPRPGGGYQWRYSPGGAGGYVNLAWDYANPAELRFADFDGDGRTDVFHATARSGGGYQWRYVSGGSAYNWQPLAIAYEAPAELRFGDFDGDGITDVFHAAPRAGGGYEWHISEDARESWVTVNENNTAPADLRFGDFDDDGITDVFTAIADQGGYQWQLSRRGRGPWINLAWAYENLGSLRAGNLYGQG